MAGGILFFTGLEGFELATTEFDQSQEYTVGDYLRAPLHNPGAADPVAHARDIAGVVTNQGAVYGSTTIVGIVSPGELGSRNGETGRDGHRNKVLSFYTTYRPPVEGLVTSTPTNGAANL